MEKKEPGKLSAEELEKRVAPLALTYTDPTTETPEAPKDAKGKDGAPSGGQVGGGGKTQT